MNYDELVFKIGIGNNCSSCKFYDHSDGYCMCKLYDKSIRYTGGKRLDECIKEFGKFKYNVGTKKWIKDIIKHKAEYRLEKTRDKYGLWTFNYIAEYDKEKYGEERFDKEEFWSYCNKNAAEIFEGLTKNHEYKYKLKSKTLKYEKEVIAIIEEVEE